MVALSRVLGSHMLDVVIDATRNPAVFDLAVACARLGGQFTLLGLFVGQPAAVDVDKLIIGDITLCAALGHLTVLPYGIQLLQSSRADPAPIGSHQFPWRRIHKL